ncbi:MAG: AfsR/SARP family transcriptional regulator [Acidimicrobiia bacterium]|nr:AfsR/SARP family transcriptional regulator [Acidimicrobiia bacterium]
MARDNVAADHPPAELLVRVLGPIEVRSDGATLHIGGPLEKKLLGALAISANHAVSVDALSYALWCDQPPVSRDNTLQTYVSRLRAVLGTSRIRSEDHCYELVVGASELDCLVFEALAAEADSMTSDPNRQVELCMRALQLWHGRPYGDFADVEPFRLEVIRLEELKLAIVETRIAAEIALGHEKLVTGSLEALVQEHPFREGFWQLLILALALGGRRVEALRSCGDLRVVLGELGLEPGPTVQRIEEAILADDRELRSIVGLLGNGDTLATA